MTNTDWLIGRDLTKAYGSGAHLTHALAGVSLAVDPGESVAIIGPPASSRLLLNILAGIVPPTTGDVTWRGQSLMALSRGQRTALRRREFGLVLQTDQLLPELSVEENVALPLLLAGTRRAEARKRARERLSEMGMHGRGSWPPHQLSDRQTQRVAIARALVASPGVVFADEPTGTLDDGSSWDVMDVLTTACRIHEASLIVATHDRNVARWCSRTVRLRNGMIASEARRPAPDHTLQGSGTSSLGSTALG